MSNLSNNALSVLKARYLLRSDTGAIVETPKELFERVARCIASVDHGRYYNDYLEMMSNLEFLPNSPTLSNAGCRTGQLSACYVLGIDDTIDSIFDTMKLAAKVHKSGGGTGFSFSNLRPRNDIVKSTRGVSSGPLGFLDMYNSATEVIKQGSSRRGANMGILLVSHPDVLEFISHKNKLDKLNNFNISVALTDDFMRAFIDGETYALINPRDGSEVSRLDARMVLDTIIVNAHKTGEPGVIFLDRMNEYCPVPWLGQYEATNPCGEQPLLPNESCNLGSINLEKFVTDSGMIDWGRLEKTVNLATRFLDNVIDVNIFPDKSLEYMAKRTRKIGLGVMGFAGMLYKLGIGYGSLKSLDIAGKVMSFVDYQSKRASIDLAKQKGSFEAYRSTEESVYNNNSEIIYKKWFDERDISKYKNKYIKYADLLPDLRKYGSRNSTTTTIAPTGTISIIADCSSGCEPVYALAYERNQAGLTMLEKDKFLEKALLTRGTPENVNKTFEKIKANKGSLVKLFESMYYVDITCSDLLETFVTAHDVSPVEHIEVQAVFQAFNDSATSKTINFPESATIKDVETAYKLAWELGCKGITVYRDNSREFQPLATIPITNVKSTKNPDSCLICGNCVPCGETCSCDKEGGS